MDTFEFEINDESRSTSKEAKSELQAQQKLIQFSVKVAQALLDKRRDHNRVQKEKVSISQLKEVYRKAAKEFNQTSNPNHTRGHWAMARVNLFTRTISHQSLSSEDAFRATLDISGERKPSSEDFFEALAIVKKYDLNYDFESADDLYLDPYKPLNFFWT